ncbi:MAG TPA: divergent PAP2 family protein [Anaerolineaceae bacterium]|nr:divergent PAP2 family protein [Anaerolineaceae bacterium]HQJ33002.1 divergent PAP2 family protein [Anaerolineaceae bacterium]
MSVLDFFTNPVGISTMLGWILGQLIKMPVEYLRHKRWDWTLLLSAGGMPSSHSSLMTATTTSIGLNVGWGSPIFALAVAVTSIIVYDATGVRRQAGFHAERINQIARELLKLKKLEENDASYLREVIGHTPGEAAAGVLFGALIALAMQWVMVWS